jgi:hypothetical protein
MSKNKLLSIVLFISNLFLVTLMLLLVALTVIMIHWNIDREFYSNVPIPIFGQKTFLSLVSVKSSSVGTVLTRSSATLNNVSMISLLILYIQLASVGVLTILSLQEFNRVIRSVRKVQTFVVNNVRSFKRIGFYMFWVFVLTGIQYTTYKESSLFGLYLHLPELMISIVALTMSEVFKEGNALLEDNRGTI